MPPDAPNTPLSAHVGIVHGASRGRYPDGNSVVVSGTDGVVVIDPSLTVHNRGGVGVPVDRVLISHAHEDHIAGVGAIGAPQICAHHADLRGLQTLDGLMEIYGLTEGPEAEAAWRADLVERFNVVGWPEATGFDGGDHWQLGGVSVTAVHLPGHTRGHTAFVVEPDGVAFVGDIDLSSFGPYYGDHWSDLDDFVASIARAGEIDAAHYVTFHHKGVVSGQAQFRAELATFAAVIGRRDEALLQLVDRGVDTVDALVAEGIVYRAGTRPGVFGTSVERRTITLHLDRLTREGVLALDGGHVVRR